MQSYRTVLCTGQVETIYKPVQNQIHGPIIVVSHSTAHAVCVAKRS